MLYKTIKIYNKSGKCYEENQVGSRALVYIYLVYLTHRANFLNSSFFMWQNYAKSYI